MYKHLPCLLAVILFVVNNAFCFSQDKTKKSNRHEIGVDVGIVVNGYSADALAYGVVLSGDYRIVPPISVGARFSANYDFDNTKVIEAGAIFRWFYIRGAYIQTYIGGDAAYVSLLKNTTPTSDMAYAIDSGCRFLFNNKKTFSPWYIEAQIRFGFPFIWSGGLVTGYRLLTP